MTAWELLSFNDPEAVSIETDPDVLAVFEEEVNTLFSDIFGNIALSEAEEGEGPEAAAISGVEVMEDDDAYTITAALVGVKPDDVQVAVAEGYVAIAGEAAEESEEEDEESARAEAAYSSFRQIVALPESANVSEAEAAMDNGVLIITIPKAENIRPGVRQLEIRQAA